MGAPNTTLLVTLTGRDRPGVTARLFTALAAHELSVLDIEQVVIRGKLVLGALLACARDPDLTAIHRGVRVLAADLGLDAEITMGSGEPPRRRGQLHVTVLGRPLTPAAIAAIAGQIAVGGANIDRIDRLADRPVTCIELDGSGADPAAPRAAPAPHAAGSPVSSSPCPAPAPTPCAPRWPAGGPSRASTWRCSAAACTGGPCGSSSWTSTRR